MSNSNTKAQYNRRDSVFTRSGGQRAFRKRTSTFDHEYGALPNRDPVSSSYVADVQRALKEKIPLHLALDDVPEKHKAAVQHQLEEMGDEFEDTKDKLDGV